MSYGEQAERLFELTTPLGTDKLLFWKMKASERLGRLFEFRLDMLSDDPMISMEDILAQPVALKMLLPDGDRYFHGHVAEFRLAGSRGRFAHYQAVVRPWLWFLTRTADCKIFQEKTVPDIITETFSELGFTDYRNSLSSSYRTWEYLVQYRESDFDFVSRLMELEGIYYYFQHENNKHTLVLADGIGAHAPYPNYDEVPYFPPDQNQFRERDHLYDWQAIKHVQSGKFALEDFDFEKPSADLTVQSHVDRGHSESTHEVYDYPGQYVVTGDGQPYVDARIQELHSQYEIVQAIGTARGMAVGYLFTLTGFDLRPDQNREYLIESTEFQLESNEYESFDSEASEICSCRLTAIESAQQYRPARITPKAVVQGPQTAIVVGKSGEEIWTDKYGRVKVQFHWDRLGKFDENSSCWIRVSQTWAGQTWGGIQIPRIGQEVIVDFLEGDPDRPLITGRVYNAEQMPPYSLPDNQTQSGVKSRSTKNGAADNFNELRFEDKIGEEEVYFHAEKDFNRVVENNDTTKVGFEKTDKGDQTIEIYNDRKVVVGNDETREIGYGVMSSGDQTVKVYNDRKATIGNKNSLVVEKSDDSTQVQMGNHSINVDMGKSTIEAMQSIELKCGGSSIKVEPAMITIKSPMIEVNASGTLILKGGVVLIN